MKRYDTLYIDGRWQRSSSGETIDVVNPATEAAIATVPAGTAADVDAAVTAARAAQASWSATAPVDRAAYLRKIAEGLGARKEEVARSITAEVGMPLKLSERIQAALPPLLTATYADLLPTYGFEERIANSLVLREAMGVAACITPWNYPLHQVMAKVAPALAAGCTVVLKPSELAPLTTWLLAEVVHDAGLPPGVFNFVCGTGAIVGEAMASHPEVNVVSFTGSTRAGRRVSVLAAQTVKRVALELGGKSAAILLDDADFARAVRSVVNGCYLNSGQTCTALTRLLVPRSRYDQVVRLAVECAATFGIGDPLDPATKLGPLVSSAQRERVRGYIRKGIEEGAQLLLGGIETPSGLERGYYVAPTVFGRVQPHMTIAQEEIFGPVLSILEYDTEAQAIEIADGTPYGLAAAVFSADEARATATARRLKAGRVDVNGGAFNVLAPFGGYKQSGRGREFGRYGLEEFLEVKALQLP
jgi:betaine-aldehyde dehydrogenase